MKIIRTSVDIDRGIYRELRRILLDKDKTFAAWIREKVKEEIRADRAGKK